MTAMKRLVRPAVTLLSLGLTTACGNTLVYGERTSLSLGIDVNTNVATPLNVNMGFNRTVAGLVPPTKKPDGSQVNGEAANMFSGFDLRYANAETRALGGKLTVKTQFASGESAIEISKAPSIAALIAGRPLAVETPEQMVRKTATIDRIKRLAAANPDGAMTLSSLFAPTMPVTSAADAIGNLAGVVTEADDTTMSRLDSALTALKQ